ncbi:MULTISPECIES: hypothetical protein [Ramlibacter]|uniref:Uncharacterized protein n=1 Tax=Ramlibacter pinisoli TaxID=2682844 RepID=A0A6N8ITG8_9BURK|nr:MULTISPECIES: hypothetical protein [Ramlibacter]MBA2965163.1 hypothetical protein [Ramlibacter sp. CGMCC 1.13660]MVQ30128.1 hypothetical protein [Ramlibacter pinisoli]
MENRLAFSGERSWSRLMRAGLMCLPALAVLACGGGGGGGGGGAPAAPSAAALVITAANAPAVAAEALETVTSTDAATAGGQFVTGVQIEGGGGSRPQLLASASLALLARPQASSTLAAGAVVSQACTGGGTISVDATTSGAASMVAGDSLRITASNCSESVDGTPTVLNGRMSIAVTSGSYDPNSPVYPKSVTLRIVSSSFSVGASGQTEVFDGDLTLALTDTTATSGTLTATSASLSSTVGARRITLGDYRLQVTHTSVDSALSVSANVESNNGQLASTPVRYTLTTETPVKVTSAGLVTAGSIRVSGSSSSLLLTVTSTDAFSLRVDSNGDGTIDSTRTITKADLQALN